MMRPMARGRGTRRLSRNLANLPDGPVGVFGSVSQARTDVPAELVRVWQDLQAGAIDRLEAAERLRGAMRRSPFAIFVSP